MINYLFYTSVYFLLVFFIYIFHETNRNNEKRFVFWSFMLLFIFAAISYDVGWDYLPYYQAMTFDMSFDRYERLEYYIVLFCREINAPQLFFVINHLIIVLFLSLAIQKESKNKYLSFIVFLCFPLFYLGGLSIIRFAAALSIIIFGYVYFLKEKKLLLFLLFLFIAYNFHAASIMAVLIIPCYYLKVPRVFNIVMLVLSFILSNVLFPLISSFEGLSFFGQNVDRYTWYVESDTNVGGQSMIHLFFLALNIINLIKYETLVKADSENAKYITLYNVGCCLAFIFSANSVFMSRFSRIYYFFIIFLIPFYSQLFPKISPKVVNRTIVFVAIVLFAYQLALPNYNGIEPGRISTYWPYRVFFLHN